jgi:hypothetical protein
MLIPSRGAFGAEALRTKPSSVPVHGGGGRRVSSKFRTADELAAKWVIPPPVAATLTLNAPSATVVDAVKVRIELPVGVNGLTEKELVTPAGTPIALSVSCCENPLRATASTVYWAVPPRGRVWEAGVISSWKSGSAWARATMGDAGAARSAAMNAATTRGPRPARR